jgi:hypothetical protein
MGLGSAAIVGLASARGKAADMRRQIDAGADPIEARRRARAEDVIPSKRDDVHRNAQIRLENAKHHYQWTQTLEAYAFPVFGDKPVHDSTPKTSSPRWNRSG